MAGGLPLPDGGRLDRAIERYQRSIEAHPTAEAHTFLGVGPKRRFEEATEELDEAIPWFEKAKQAKRYEPRQFPFMNLGQVFLRQGRWWEALREFEGAVRLVPRDHDAAKMLHHVRARLN
jgi:tetratricopeptide (TPR) repeat protein